MYHRFTSRRLIEHCEQNRDLNKILEICPSYHSFEANKHETRHSKKGSAYQREVNVFVDFLDKETKVVYEKQFGLAR